MTSGRARVPAARQVTALLNDVRARAGITVETGTVISTAAGAPHPAHVEKPANGTAPHQPARIETPRGGEEMS